MRPEEIFCPWNMGKWVLNDHPHPRWIDEDTFLFERDKRSDAGSIETETVCVNCQEGTQRIIPKTPAVKKKQEPEGCPAPNGQLTAFRKDHNIWLRSILNGKEWPVTTDGEKNNEYGDSPEFHGRVGRTLSEGKRPPDVLWSPDSQSLLICRVDQRAVADTYVIQHCTERVDSIRPVLHTYKCPFAGEPVPMTEFYLYLVPEGVLKKLDIPAQPSYSALLHPQFSAARWMNDSSGFYLTWFSRGNKEARFYAVSRGGACTCILSEKSDTFLNQDSFGQQDGFGTYRFSNFMTKDGRWVFWQSERENLARFYRYDAHSGKCLGAVTPSDSMAGKILAVDERQGWIYYYGSNIPGSGDPYYEKLCRVRFDGGDFRVLTPEDGMHRVSTNGKYLVDTWSRVDKPPVTVLRKMDGTFIREIIRADISELLSKGYVIPERFSVPAEDGTVLYGILVKPSNLCPDSKVPIVDYIYGGMQCYNVPKEFTWESRAGRESMGGLQNLAQAGIAGIIIDGRGTPGRGRHFHQHCYRNIRGCAGLQDHVCVLKILQQRYPFLDISRAGIWGSSGGGMAAARAMLEYPGVYKAAVAAAGNHDQRMYDAAWVERYNGLYDPEIYLDGDVTALASNLCGHLLLAHGAMDDNVPLSQCLRLTDALQMADKDFDLMILPRTDHNVPADPYFIRRKNRYFLKYLS